MFCIQCGAKNPEGARFCQQCGKLLAAAAQRAAAPSPASAIRPAPSGPPLPDLEIRPNARRNAVMLAACGAGAVLVAVVIGPGEMRYGLAILVWGGLSGLACLWIAWRLWNQRVSLVLRGSELEWITPVGAARIRYNDIAEAGITKMFGISQAGIKLASYDHLVEGMSPQFITYYRRSLPLQRFGGSLMTKILFTPPLDHLIEAALKAFGQPNMMGTIRNMGNSKTIEDNFRLSRQFMGFDFMFNRVVLDRSPEDFVALLRQYMARAPLA